MQGACSLARLWLEFETLQVKHATFWVWYQFSPVEMPPPARLSLIVEFRI